MVFSPCSFVLGSFHCNFWLHVAKGLEHGRGTHCCTKNELENLPGGQILLE